LAACVFWAVGSISSRHTKGNAEPLTAAALQMLTGGVALSMAAFLHGDFSAVDVAAISTRSWSAFFYLIVFGSLVGFSTFVWLIKHATPAHVSTYAYVNPVVAVFLGWLILREPVSPRIIVASVIIITAVVIITVEKSRSAKTV
jgi:drug/metabolite transporter (DMT)-like permease